MAAEVHSGASQLRFIEVRFFHRFQLFRLADDILYLPVALQPHPSTYNLPTYSLS
jgi:hypothetical protein